MQFTKLTNGQIFRFASYTAFAIALAGMLGSLYFSEVAGLVPCLLCWYQRIALYPLVLIIGVGIIRQDRAYPFYALPLTVIGGLTALYHVMLQAGVIAEQLAPCSAGVSCAAIEVAYLGFITIPVLSLVAFALMSGLMVWVLRTRKESQ